VSGFTSRPDIQRTNRNGIYIFVNRRLVRDRLILHAIHEAYRNILPPAVFPATLLFLEMPYDEVDVNVHPAKSKCASGVAICPRFCARCDSPGAEGCAAHRKFCCRPPRAFRKR